MSTWLMPRLSALPLRWIISSLLAAGLFLAGHRLGQQGVQQAWDAERMQQQTAALAQSLQVAQVQTQQEQINQRISTDHDTRKNQLQHLWRPQKPPTSPISSVFASSGTNDQRSDAERLRKPASSPDSPSTVSAHADPARGVDAAPSHAVSDPASAQIPVTCEQLASDAAQATLMVLSFQRWYAEQARDLEQSR
jgi:hypothetical protein